MRSAIWDLLNAAVPEMGGRWFQPHAVTAATPKPFGVIREGVQDEGLPWGPGSTVVEVWPYVAQGSFVAIDALVAKIIAALDGARFAEGAVEYLSEHEGSASQDVFDPDWKALTRPVRFRVHVLGWLSGLTYAPDPVAALRAWTEAQLPATQQDPATWNPQDATPGVYWRLVTVAVAPEGMRAWGAWMDAQLRAHVVTRSDGPRLTTLRTLAERLATTKQLALSDGSPLFFREIGADSEADPMRTGQVRLAARFGVLNQPPDPVPQPIQQPSITLLATAQIGA